MPDSTPNYLTVDSAGNIGALFPGGLQVNEDTSGTNPPASRAVRWVRQSDGSVIAEIFAFQTGPPNTPTGHIGALELHATPDATVANPAASLIVQADQPGLNRYASIEFDVGTVGNWPGAPDAGIKIDANHAGGNGGVSLKMLMDSNGLSNFVQTAQNRNTNLSTNNLHIDGPFTIATFSCPGGGATTTLSVVGSYPGGISTILGQIVISSQPSGHYNYTINQNPGSMGIVNNGVTQNLTIQYLIVYRQ